MKHRKLRIAWSVGWGVLCVLLVVLWARSYNAGEMLYTPLNAEAVWVRTFKGQIMYQRMKVDKSTLVRGKWSVTFNSNEHYMQMQLGSRQWVWADDGSGTFSFASVPFYFLVVASIALSLAPWFAWRFSLRTLLVAATLVAIVLGTIAVWAQRSSLWVSVRSPTMRCACVAPTIGREAPCRI